MEALHYSSELHELALDQFDKSLREILHEDTVEQPVRQIKRVRINAISQAHGERIDQPMPLESQQPLQQPRRESRGESEQDAQYQQPPQNMSLRPQQTRPLQPCRRPSSSSPATPVVTKNLIDNELTISKSRAWINVLDPTTQKFLARVPESTLPEIQAAVKAAEAAQPSWDLLGISRRRSKMLALVDAIRRHRPAFQRALQIEIGKTWQDADAEVDRALDAVETACSLPMESFGKHWNNNKTEVFTLHQPLGVCVSITPFNFPLMIPLWSIPIALVCGNTVVLKPSEKAPSVAALLGDCFMSLNLPPGVFNIVHGAAGAVDKLLAQPSVSAVSFVGSELVGERVFEHAKATKKRVQVESAGKNHGVLLKDAVKSKSLYAIAGSAFGSAGQRCMALSVLVCVGPTVDWIDELVTIARSLKVGSGLDSHADIGPLITAATKERVEAMIDSAEAEGAMIMLDGRNVSVPGCPQGNFVGPTIITEVRPYMQCYQDEIFGPVLVCLAVDTLEEAIEIVNENRFGNGCTLFTTSPIHAQAFQLQVNVGQVGINVPVLAPSGPVARTTNKDSYLGAISGCDQWQFFTTVKTVTTLWPPD